MILNIRAALGPDGSKYVGAVIPLWTLNGLGRVGFIIRAICSPSPPPSSEALRRTGRPSPLGRRWDGELNPWRSAPAVRQGRNPLGLDGTGAGRSQGSLGLLRKSLRRAGNPGLEDAIPLEGCYEIQNTKCEKLGNS
jgi:hypothetical protein